MKCCLHHPCANKQISRGLCGKHYQYYRYHKLTFPAESQYKTPQNDSIITSLLSSLLKAREQHEAQQPQDEEDYLHSYDEDLKKEIAHFKKTGKISTNYEDKFERWGKDLAAANLNKPKFDD